MWAAFNSYAQVQNMEPSESVIVHTFIMFVVIVIILVEVLTYYNTTSYLRLHAETPTSATSKKSPAKKSGGKKKASSGKKAVGVSSAGPLTFILAYLYTFAAVHPFSSLSFFLIRRNWKLETRDGGLLALLPRCYQGRPSYTQKMDQM